MGIFLPIEGKKNKISAVLTSLVIKKQVLTDKIEEAKILKWPPNHPYWLELRKTLYRASCM